MPAPQDSPLQVQALSKTFSGVRVLIDVGLTVQAGEVHALLGQNGSGKSTLIKCLAGVHRADSGATTNVAGRRLPDSYAPSEASSFGLAFVHQDLGLLGDMTVAENLALGTGFARSGPLISWRRQRQRARDALDAFGLDLPVGTRVRDLPVTARTLLAIARAFQPHPGTAAPLSCLVLDEPTSALPDHDAELLFTAIERVTAAGAGVLYVTHRLEEVFRIAARATVLRDGQHVGTHRIADITRRELVDAIIGDRAVQPRRPATGVDSRRTAPAAPVAFRATGLSGVRVRDADLSVRRGEIVGLAGLAGSGRSELARLVAGAQTPTAGHRQVGGRPLVTAYPRDAIRAGIAMVPEDRRREGCVLTMSVAHNLTLPGPAAGRLGLLDLRRERRQVAEEIGRAGIRPADPDRTLSTLSGGNQQKVVVAKWLARHPALLVLDEPVQGIDVGAKADLFAQVRHAASGGMAALVVDSDFDNLVELCDRVLVIRAGRLVDELAAARLTYEEISRVTFGVPDEHPSPAVRPLEESA